MKLLHRVLLLATAVAGQFTTSPPAETGEPTVSPMNETNATMAPTMAPVNMTTMEPTMEPMTETNATMAPTMAPVNMTTMEPTMAPMNETMSPTMAPVNMTGTMEPTMAPMNETNATMAPTMAPVNMTETMAPTMAPTNATAPSPGPYPPCPICPEGQEIGNPDQTIPVAGFTCLEANNAGLAGMISPGNCTLLQQAGPGFCGCQDISPAETMTPTQAPTAEIEVPPPTTGDCTATNCAAVTSWDAIGAFVQAAASGDSLCICGHSFFGDECGSPAVLDTEKDITIECVGGRFCTYNCPLAAFVVEAGSLTVTGTAENFEFEGGLRYSRVVVGEEGTFSASQVIFRNTASNPPPASTSRRHLQESNGFGGGIQTKGMTTVTDSVFRNCTAFTNGGAVYVDGGVATFEGVTFEQNKAYEGAGIFARSGSIVVTGSTFADNVVTNTATDPDLFYRSGVSVDACGNTADSDALNNCSGASMLWTATSAALVIGLAMTLFA